MSRSSRIRTRVPTKRATIRAPRAWKTFSPRSGVQGAIAHNGPPEPGADETEHGPEAEGETAGDATARSDDSAASEAEGTAAADSAEAQAAESAPEESAQSGGDESRDPPATQTEGDAGEGDEAPEKTREQIIDEALARMDRDNPDLWTGSGAARVDALEAESGLDLKAADRDAAMERAEAAK